MGKTSIQWTDHSLNPIRARLNGRQGHYCEKVSPGCKNCYSSNMQRRFGMPEFAEQRREGVEHFLDPKALQQVLSRKKPTKYFWCDMSDLFGSWVKDEWIAACFGVMAATPQHIHQVLTKRPGRALEWFSNERGVWDLLGIADEAIGYPLASRLYDCVATHDELGNSVPTWPLPNVWLGVSVEDQKAADERIPLLLQCDAAVHWISAEPLLGPLELRNENMARGDYNWLTGEWHDWSDGTPASRSGAHCISWVVVGGESGSKARPCQVEWIRSLVHQCRYADVPVFVKQLGARYVDAVNGIGGKRCRPDPELVPPIRHLNDSKGGDISEFPEDLRVRQYPTTQQGARPKAR